MQTRSGPNRSVTSANGVDRQVELEATRRAPAASGESVWSSPTNVATEIYGIAASLDEVDARSAARLRDLGQALTSSRGRGRWTDVDLPQAFNTDRLSFIYALRREGGYAPKTIEVADKVRNVLVLVPILLTWAALAEAAVAYNKFIEKNPDEQGTPFLLLWQRGFGGESSWFSPTFSTVAIIDAVVIIAMILLTFYTHGRKEQQEDNISDTAAAFQSEFDNVLAEATVLLAGDRANRPMQLTQSVDRLASRFERSSQELLTQLQLEHDRLEHVATRREKEFSDLGMFATNMRSGAEEMHRLLVNLRQVSTGLESALEDLTSDIAATTDQQKSMLTAVTSLERMIASNIQSDQAASRQFAQAASNLAETADKAIGGAEAAAQAGQVASDAVRGMGDIIHRLSSGQSGAAAGSSDLAEAVRISTNNAQTTARSLAEIGTGLTRIREEFERLGSNSGQQANALNSILNQQAEIARDISQVAKEMGSVGLTTAQRQREVNQDLGHLVQRLDSLANTLNRMVQQTPSAENLAAAFQTALRNEIGRSTRNDVEPGPEERPRSTGWVRSNRS